MTPDEIRAAYQAVVAAATSGSQYPDGTDVTVIDALAAAGLLPTVEETAENVFSQNSTLTTTTVVWHTQHRYVTAWADVSGT